MMRFNYRAVMICQRLREATRGRTHARLNNRARAPWARAQPAKRRTASVRSQRQTKSWKGFCEDSAGDRVNKTRKQIFDEGARRGPGLAAARTPWLQHVSPPGAVPVFTLLASPISG